MSVRDKRRPPFAWIGLGPLERVRREVDPARQQGVRNALLTLAEAASRRRDGWHENGDTLKELAAIGGISERRLRAHLHELARIGLVRIDERTANGRDLPTVYVLLGSDKSSDRSDTADVDLPDETSGPTRTRPTAVQEQEQEHLLTPAARTVRYNGELVADLDLGLAEQLLARFNEVTGTSYPPYTKTGRPSAPLQSVIGAVLDLDGLTLDVGQRMIRHALADPFWTPSLPQPGNVFGPGVRDRNFQATARRQRSRSGATSFVERHDRRRAA